MAVLELVVAPCEAGCNAGCEGGTEADCEADWERCRIERSEGFRRFACMLLLAR